MGSRINSSTTSALSSGSTGSAGPLQRDVAQVLRDPDVLKRYDAMFYEPYALERAEYVKELADETRRFGLVLQRLNIALD